MVESMLCLPKVKPLQPNKTSQSKQPKTLKKPNKASFAGQEAHGAPAREQRKSCLLSYILNYINIKIKPLLPPGGKKVGESKRTQGATNLWLSEACIGANYLHSQMVFLLKSCNNSSQKRSNTETEGRHEGMSPWS